MITRVLANVTVSELDRAQQWYSAVFDAEPDASPMPGLLEWRVGDTTGVQVWTEPERAGRSAAVLGVDDIDAAAARLTAAGIAHEGPQPGGGARILQLADPDGNRIVLTGE